MPISAQTSGRARRLAVALALGLAAFALSELLAILRSPGLSDFADLWHGVVVWQAGGDPYAAVRALHRDVALYYPFPALLLCWPLGWLPLHHAEAVFVGLGIGTFAYAAWGSPLLVAVLSASVLANITQGQWSPLVTATAVLPGVGLVWAAKPSTGLAFAVSFPHRRAFLAAALLGLLSIAVWPGWIAAWLPGLNGTVHIAPVRRAGGALLLLALLKWRRPEARLLTALALIPQTGTLYDTVPLFLIPRTRWEAYGLAALTQIAAVVANARLKPGMDLVTSIDRRWPVLLLLVYLPALALLLRPRDEAGGLG